MREARNAIQTDDADGVAGASKRQQVSESGAFKGSTADDVFKDPQRVRGDESLPLAFQVLVRC